MRRRNKLPERWLFTDERQGERLWDALQKLPRGSGVVFRHYDAPNRAELLRRVAEIAKRRSCSWLSQRREGCRGRLLFGANT